MKTIKPQTIAKLEEIWKNEENRLIIRANAKTALDVINGELQDETFIDAIPEDLHLLGKSKEKDKEIIDKFYEEVEQQIDSVSTSGIVIFSCVVGCDPGLKRKMLFFDEHISDYIKERGYCVTQFITIDSGKNITEIECLSGVILYYFLIMAHRN
jgi:hypothetical protein